MNWKIKANIQSLLSIMPGGWSLNTLFHRIRVNKDFYYKRCITQLKWLLKTMEYLKSFDSQDVNCFELGTGYALFGALMMHLCGFHRITTIDQKKILSKRITLLCYNEIVNNLSNISKVMKIETDVLRSRIDKWTLDEPLEQFMKRTNITYLAPFDICDQNLPSESFDILFTHAVLEHVRPPYLPVMHKKLFRVLKPGGIAFHYVGCHDHFALQDSNITARNFLRFSEDEWLWYGGHGINYHNRLLWIQHKEIIEHSGFTVLSEEKSEDHQFKKISKKFPVAPQFRNFSLSELATTQVHVILKRPLLL